MGEKGWRKTAIGQRGRKNERKTYQTMKAEEDRGQQSHKDKH